MQKLWEEKGHWFLFLWKEKKANISGWLCEVNASTQVPNSSSKFSARKWYPPFFSIYCVTGRNVSGSRTLQYIFFFHIRRCIRLKETFQYSGVANLWLSAWFHVAHIRSEHVWCKSGSFVWFYPAIQFRTKNIWPTIWLDYKRY